MAEKQRNERKATRFDGVYQRESRTRMCKGKPDVCFTIDYRDPVTGKRVRETVGWRSQQIDAAYANGVRQARLAVGRKDKYADIMPQKEEDVPTLAQAWGLYHRDWLEARGSGNIATDTGFYKNHLQKLAHRRLSQITAHDLEGVSADVQRKGLSPQTAKHVLAFVRRVMRKMVAWKKWRGPLPFDDVKMPRVNNQRVRYLTPFEAVALLEALQGLSPRAWLMSLVSLHCGLRFGEIKKLRRSDLDFEAGTILVRDPKGGRDRYAIMTARVRDALAAFPGGSPSALLFPTQSGKLLYNVDSAFDAVVEAFEFNSGIGDTRQRVVFHTLRHTYASWLARSGRGQATIAELLGHATLEMSRRYTHLMRDARREAADAVDMMFTHAAHPEIQG